MMTISETLNRLRSENRKALAPFATVGDPDRAASLDVFRGFGDWGADLIELGIPYSDPLMDGPTLQRSYRRALDAGFKLKDLPKFIEDIRKKSDTPMLVMTCVNPIYRYGEERFCRDVAGAGVDALLITDLPPEEWGSLRETAERHKLGTIFLVTPNTPPERVKLLDSLSSPFVYCVSKAGVTGAGDKLPPELGRFIDTIKNTLTKPALIGFGISTPEHARTASALADGVIIGSAVVNRIEKNLGDNASIISSVDEFLTSVRKAMDE